LHGEKIYLEGNKVRPEQAAEMYFQYLIVMPHATTASSVRIHKTKFDTFGLFSPAMLCKVCSPEEFHKLSAMLKMPRKD